MLVNVGDTSDITLDVVGGTKNKSFIHSLIGFLGTDDFFRCSIKFPISFPLGHWSPANTLVSVCAFG